MIVLIDNYDSFTYNLYQYIGEIDTTIKVYRNDKITAQELLEMKPDKIVISPGPKDPEHAGNCLDIIQKLWRKVPILGICLGHQCIARAFGGNIVHAKTLFHGKTSYINHSGKAIFKNLASPLKVARYHSLIIEKESMPECLEIIAQTKDNEIMAIKHKEAPVIGLQFHPESIMTEAGKQLIKNYLEKESG